MLREFLSKAFVSLCLKAGGSLIGFLFALLLARELGAAETGIYFLCLSIITIIATVARLGLDMTTTRFVARYLVQRQPRQIFALHNSLTLTVFASGLVIALPLAYFSEPIAARLFEKPTLSAPLATMLLAVPFLSVYWLKSRIYQGYKNMLGFQVYQFLGISSLMLSTLAFTSQSDIFVKIGVSHVATIYLVSSIFLALMSLLLWYAKTPDKLRYWQVDHAPLIKSSKPLFYASMLTLAITYFPTLLLGHYGSAEDIGVFTVSLRIAALTSLVLAAVNGIAFPKFAALYEQNEIEKLMKITIWSTRVMLLLALPFLLMFLLFPGEVLKMFGDSFVNGAQVLIILALGQLFNVMSGSVGGLLNMTGNENTTFKINLFCCFATVIMSFSLIPYWGATGAAISTALGVIIQMSLFSFKVKQLIGFTPMNVFKTV